MTTFHIMPIHDTKLFPEILKEGLQLRGYDKGAVIFAYLSKTKLEVIVSNKIGEC